MERLAKGRREAQVREAHRQPLPLRRAAHHPDKATFAWRKRGEAQQRPHLAIGGVLQTQAIGQPGQPQPEAARITGENAGGPVRARIGQHAADHRLGIVVLDPRFQPVLVVLQQHQPRLIVEGGELPLDADLKGKLPRHLATIEMTAVALEAIPGAAPKIGLLVRYHLQTVVCLVPLGRFIEPTPRRHFHHPALLPYRA